MGKKNQSRCHLGADMDVLKEWLRKAARAESIEEFERVFKVERTQEKRI